jgi:hypothetical protein
LWLLLSCSVKAESRRFKAATRISIYAYETPRSG